MGEQPFETLIAKHHPEIHRYLARVAPRVTDADDLSQETFLRAYRAYGGLPADANVRAWLFAIATNLARNHHRSERRRSRAQAGARATRAVLDGDDPEGQTVASETRAVVGHIVATLPLKQRLAFTLRKVHELEYGEVGESLGCSGESARAHVFQALKKIRIGLNGAARPATEGRR